MLIKVESTIQAIVIPTGEAMLIFAGQEVEIFLKTPISCTVKFFSIFLYITYKDLGAIGRKIGVLPSDKYYHSSGKNIHAFLIQQCKLIYDPEIAVNIYDLGLIYKLKSVWQADKLKYDISVIMTLTSPSCGMGKTIIDTLKDFLEMFKAVDVVTIDIVFAPPWDISKMSTAGKLQLGLL